jgi:two-component system, NtrC family, sensor histidine kinase AtoS
MTSMGYAFLALTAMVAMLAGTLMFAVLRFATAARESRRHLGDSRAESSLLVTALEDAIAKLKVQARATTARAEASERLSGAIISSLSAGLIVVDSAGSVQTVNPAAARILELPETQGVPYARLLHDYASLRDLISESLHTRLPIRRRTVSLNRTRGAMRLGVTVSPLTAEAGPGGAVCLFTDLTAVLALEDQLRLKEALARVGELSAGLAHEFRNGLATIHGYARLLDPSQLPPPQRPYVEGLRDETHALTEVVTRFLEFAKPTPLALARADLRTIIARASEDVPTAHILVSGECGEIEADDVLLRQALSNIFRNSVEACSGGRVVPDIRVESRLDPDQGLVILEIRDNGPGIAPHASSQLFQPFFTTRPGGTGLGLAIVQKIVVSHNGHIAASNNPEGGAVFTVTLPLRPVAVATDS